MKLRGKIESVVSNHGHSLTMRARCNEVTAYGASIDCADTFDVQFTVLNRAIARRTYYIGREITLTVEPA
jgi:hypothetical protein